MANSERAQAAITSIQKRLTLLRELAAESPFPQDRYLRWKQHTAENLANDISAAEAKRFKHADAPARMPSFLERPNPLKGPTKCGRFLEGLLKDIEADPDSFFPEEQ